MRLSSFGSAIASSSSSRGILVLGQPTTRSAGSLAAWACSASHNFIYVRVLSEASNVQRGKLEDRRPARGEIQANAKASYVQGGWRVVVVVDAVDLVLGRARRARAAAARRKSRE